jgi:uncharacterized protein (TIGR02217 family)
MAITVFADVILSNSVLAAGVQGRQIRRNERNTQVNGAEYINPVWTQTLREYDWETVPLRTADWQYLERLHEGTDAGAYGFLMEDPKDSSVGAGAGVVTGLTSTTFQLEKLYTIASRTKRRKITRPRSAGFVVMVSGAPLGGGDYTLDTTTGIITIPSAPLANQVTWTGRFYVPVHFKSDTIDWTMIAAGPDPDARYLAGQSVVLQEVRE